MGWTDLWLRIRALASRRRVERELDEELSFHLEMEARENRLAGMSEAEARRAARVEFGGVEQAKEECRDTRGVAFLENLARDLRYGARVLLKTPLFTAVAILSLAIGIGANTAIFSLVDSVLLRLLPVRSPEQLVILKWSANQQPGELHSYANSSHRDGQGRPIVADDDTVDGVPAAVVSYRFWERAFGLDPAAIGKTICVNRQPFVVVGVTPPEFFGVSAGGFVATPEIDVSLPLRPRAAPCASTPCARFATNSAPAPARSVHCFEVLAGGRVDEHG
jgi:hypothetical protein